MLRNIRNKIRKNRGFTLVELMIVVAIVGILAALAIYGVTRYMKNAKTAEARNSIGQIAKDASAAFSREKMAPGVLKAKDSTDVVNTLCGSASPVPGTMTAVKAMKYQSSPTEWAPKDADPASGWTCLKFSMDQPQYYQYDYQVTGVEFDAIAQGDLNGDGTVFSTFKLAGAVQNGTVAVSPSIEELNAEE